MRFPFFTHEAAACPPQAVWRFCHETFHYGVFEGLIIYVSRGAEYDKFSWEYEKPGRA